MCSYSLQNSPPTCSLLTVATTDRCPDQVHQIIVTAIMLGHASCVRKETVGQLDTLKKNVTKQEKDSRDVSTSTLWTMILMTTLTRT